MADARRAVKTLLSAHHDDTPPGSHFLVAVSGGADSLALAWAAQFVLPRQGYSLEAVVVDHGIQAQSAEIAEEAARTCQVLGLHARVVKVSLGGRSGVLASELGGIRASGDGMEGGVEHQARLARYDALRAVQRESGAHGVLLGHTMDDQAEGVLLGLARGSGPGSLRGMAERNQQWWRPFLGLRRADTRQVCLDAGISWWDDPHNDDDVFARPRVRHHILPAMERELGPGVVEALARTAILLRTDDDALDQIASAIADQEQRAHGAGVVSVDTLSSQPWAISSRVVRRVAFDVAQSALSYDHTDRVMALVSDWHGQGPIDIPGASVVREGDCLRIVPRTTR